MLAIGGFGVEGKSLREGEGFARFLFTLLNFPVTGGCTSTSCRLASNGELVTDTKYLLPPSSGVVRNVFRGPTRRWRGEVRFDHGWSETTATQRIMHMVEANAQFISNIL